MRQKWLRLTILLTVLGAVAGFLLKPSARGRAARQTELSAAESSPPPARSATASRVPAGSPAAPARAAVQFERDRRDALAEQITERLENVAARGDSRSADASHASTPAPGNLLNRTGGRQQLVEHLNRDFMPLARDCIEQAQERSPELEGMLWIDVE